MVIYPKKFLKTTEKQQKLLKGKNGRNVLILVSPIQYDWNTSLFPLVFWKVKQNISKGNNEDWYGGKEKSFQSKLRVGSRALKILPEEE